MSHEIQYYSHYNCCYGNIVHAALQFIAVIFPQIFCHNFDTKLSVTDLLSNTKFRCPGNNDWKINKWAS